MLNPSGMVAAAAVSPPLPREGEKEPGWERAGQAGAIFSSPLTEENKGAAHRPARAARRHLPPVRHGERDDEGWPKAHCKESGGYGTPSLNDKLYLHFKDRPASRISRSTPASSQSSSRGTA